MEDDALQIALLLRRPSEIDKLLLLEDVLRTRETQSIGVVSVWIGGSVLRKLSFHLHRLRGGRPGCLVLLEAEVVERGADGDYEGAVERMLRVVGVEGVGLCESGLVRTDHRRDGDTLRDGGHGLGHAVHREGLLHGDVLSRGDGGGASVVANGHFLLLSSNCQNRI